MKNPTFRPNHKRKEQTLNCKPDNHARFCKRCVSYNNGCPNTGYKYIVENKVRKYIVDHNCSL